MLGGLVEIVDTINTQFMDRKVKKLRKKHNIYVSQDILNIRNGHNATNKQSRRTKTILLSFGTEYEIKKSVPD